MTDDEIQRSRAMANWGSGARKGARNVTQERNDIDRELLPPESTWEFKDDGVHRHRADEFREQVETAVERARKTDVSPPARERGILRPRTPIGLETAMKRAYGADLVKRNLRRLDNAANEFSDDHPEAAAKLVKPLLQNGSAIAEVRELSGLINYRLGKWQAAIEDLETFREITGSAEQHPVLADCYRAIGHWDDVDALWLELGEQSPSAELVTEGRIVTAGALADRGRLADAVRMLEKGWKAPKRPGEHHLRRAYALADLYERSGATVKARQLFGWISGHDARFADVKHRLRELSG